MFAISMLGAIFYLGTPAVMEYGTQYWGATNNFVLVAVPLFVLLGELLVRGGFTDRMYRSLSDWLNPLPGGLLHTNIGASAMFAAVSGSSVATAATIGTVAIPAFKGRNYDPRLVLGTIAAGATLGILIPPSINMIIYGAMTNTSVGRLYAAGVIPGLLLTGLFMAVIVVACWWKPSLAGAKSAPAPLGERLRRLVDLLPPTILFVVVMGSIYLGWATPTESAALGVVMALVLCIAYGKFSIKMLHECFVTTVSVTAMIMLIAAAAFYLNFVLGLMGVPQALANFASQLGTSPLVMLAVLTVFYLILGCFLDALAMIIGTIPIVFPLDHGTRHRPGLVRHLPGGDGRTGADHAAGGHEPVRRAGHPQGRADHRRHRRHAAVPGDDAAAGRAAGGLARPRAVAAAGVVRLKRSD